MCKNCTFVTELNKLDIYNGNYNSESSRTMA